MDTFVLITLEALLFITLIFLFFLDRKNRELTRKLDISHDWQSKRITSIARDVAALRSSLGDIRQIHDKIEALNAQVYLLGEELDKLTYEKYEEAEMTDDERQKAKRAEKLFTEGIASILGYDLSLSGKRDEQ